MHVLLIHQAFGSPREAGGTRHYELAQRLVANDNRFTVVTSRVSYMTGKQAETIADGESVDGIRVVRAYALPSHHQSFLRRIFSFLSFMASSAWAAWKVKDVDLVMGTSPPLFQAVSAWLVARLRRKPFLLEIRDLWPEFAIECGVLRNRWLIGLARQLERFLYAKADHILVNSPAYRDYLLNRGIKESKISFIPNGVDTQTFDAVPTDDAVRIELGLRDEFVVMYAGALGLANDIDTILNAAARLQNDPQIHFVLVGDGKERSRLEEMKNRLGLSNVTFAGARDKAEMPRMLAAADACVATLKNIPMFRTTYPNKVFDYMAASRPTVLAIDGVIRQVVEAAGGGIAVPPGDPASLANAVQRLSQDRDQAREMGQAACEYVTVHFNRDQHAIQLAQLCRRLQKAA